jgi:hypothetical protein
MHKKKPNSNLNKKFGFEAQKRKIQFQTSNKKVRFEVQI